jgi:ribosomal-protein-alanine N-acetyltransferase
MRSYQPVSDIELEKTDQGIFYRMAEELDIFRLLEIERDVYYGQVPWVVDHFKHEIVDNPLAGFIVAEKDDVIAGFLGFRISPEAKQVHITNLAVATRYQDQGIASGLIRTAEDLIGQLGEQTVTLEVKRTNQRAQGLYRGQGFSTEKIVPGYYDDGTDAVFMTKSLKASDDHAD